MANNFSICTDLALHYFNIKKGEIYLVHLYKLTGTIKPCSMKFSREFNFVDCQFFAFRGSKFSRIRISDYGSRFFHVRYLYITAKKYIMLSC